ncbi:DUF2637 domain-containing protein [Rhodococcus artemisiae]|uniref:DUF2637 domain-containing protein n=1 Tax=Rhodococcus artemisiae TaxID=714159 RepID=A0ABU7LJE0_9NOCA|nr:DUF2637 domain-containing protein [Rhodococcus artemisiae]MEE2061686.1 DUF2637 domain-containing protein [Rhodococcus artemisiae]
MSTPMWIGSVAITVGIAAASFILSFIALRDLSIQAGQPREIAFLFPVIIDGTILQATMGVVTRRHDRQARRFFWKILIGAAAVSIAGNAIHAVLTHASGFNVVLAAVIAALPPISLLASTHALTKLGRHATLGTETKEETAKESKSAADNLTPPPSSAPHPITEPGTRAIAHQLEVPLAHLAATPGATASDPTAMPNFGSHEERREWALARRKAGVDVPVIAQEVDRSIATVYRWFSEAPEVEHTAA